MLARFRTIHPHDTDITFVSNAPSAPSCRRRARAGLRVVVDGQELDAGQVGLGTQAGPT